ncbi:hypothetical protein RIF29_15206 [Crotalaria pallida]|uniref:Uncharacterized protein n=1 Tax=Crotalaria pallida TaxID=3830 RepID=A0AAN9FEI3_CROPI
MEKKKPSREDIEKLDDTLRLKEALENETIPEENRAAAMEQLKELDQVTIAEMRESEKVVSQNERSDAISESARKSSVVIDSGGKNGASNQIRNPGDGVGSVSYGVNLDAQNGEEGH